MATKGTAVPTAPSVILRDQSGTPVPGVAVTFGVTAGGGDLSGSNQTSGANGVARVGSWTLGPNAGPNALAATSTGLAGSPVVFTAMGAETAQPTTLDWFSDWRTGTGNGADALFDGTTTANRKWDDVDFLCGPSQDLLQVIAASGKDFPTTNVLRAQTNGDQCKVLFRYSDQPAGPGWSAPAVGEYLFLRFYQRNEHANGVSLGLMHSLESHNGTVAWEFAWETASGGTYKFDFLLNTGVFNTARWYKQLSTNTTYRVELRLQRGVGTFTAQVRLFNSAGTLVADNTSFLSEGNGLSLASVNPSGLIGNLGQAFQSINVGQSGQSSAGVSTTGILFGGLAVRVTSDPNGWIGPYPLDGVESAPGPPSPSTNLER